MPVRANTEAAVAATAALQSAIQYCNTGGDDSVLDTDIIDAIADAVPGITTDDDIAGGIEYTTDGYGTVTPKTTGLLSPEPAKLIVTLRTPFANSKRRRVTSGLPEQIELVLSPPADMSGVTYNKDSAQSQQVVPSITNKRPTVDAKPTLTVTKRKHGRKTAKVPIRGGWDVLPHNMGNLWTSNTESKTEDSTVDNTAEAPAISAPNAGAISESKTVLSMCDTDAPKPATRYSLRNRKAITTPVAHGTSVQEDAAPIIAQDTESNLKITGSRNELDGAPPKKRQRRSKKAAAEDGNSQTKETGIATKPKRKARRTKDNPYGMMPGETPYPDWVAPTAEECQEVYDILAEIHDDVKALPPEKIPAPSLDVAGCGEVPSVLDGLIRTVLSGSTTFESADKMLKALVARFGVLEVGVGKGSVNWNNIRVAEHDDVYAQLKDGGLGKIKTKHIQGILSMVHDENMESRAAYLVETESGVHADIAGASTKTEGQKKLEILKADQDMLSLDHMHDMETQEAMKHFVRYPGVGVKTAACVTLFSLQRPCFAVDTHVFRLSKWLAWVPQKTNEDDTFSHLEFRCPDKLKYGLHQLFIRHGKTCHRCNDKSFLGTDAWNASRCPLEQLVNRYTKRVAKLKEIEAENKKKGKDKVTAKGKRLQQGAGQNTGLTKIAKDEDDATDSELSELDEADVDM